MGRCLRGAVHPYTGQVAVGVEPQRGHVYARRQDIDRRAIVREPGELVVGVVGPHRDRVCRVRRRDRRSIDAFVARRGNHRDTHPDGSLDGHVKRIIFSGFDVGAQAQVDHHGPVRILLFPADDVLHRHNHVREEGLAVVVEHLEAVHVGAGCDPDEPVFVVDGRRGPGQVHAVAVLVADRGCVYEEDFFDHVEVGLPDAGVEEVEVNARDPAAGIVICPDVLDPPRGPLAAPAFFHWPRPSSSTGRSRLLLITEIR